MISDKDRCAEEELIEFSPAASVGSLADETKHDKVLSDSEIRAVWQACSELGAFGRAFRFMLLSDLALSVLDECPQVNEFVFTTGQNAPISGWSKAKAALDKRSGVNGWRVYDLRRTCVTNLAKLGVDRVCIGKILNHAEHLVTVTYDRHRYEAEKRTALDLWAARLFEIVSR